MNDFHVGDHSIFLKFCFPRFLGRVVDTSALTDFGVIA